MLQRATTQQQRFEAGVREVFTAGDGCMTLVVVSAASAGSIIDAVMAGDVAARTILTAVDQLLRQIERRSRPRALPCMLCDNNRLWRGVAPAAIGVLMPFGIAPATAIGMAVCANCVEVPSDCELAQTMVAKLRDGWLPGLRILPPMTAAGHA